MRFESAGRKLQCKLFNWNQPIGAAIGQSETAVERVLVIERVSKRVDKEAMVAGRGRERAREGVLQITGHYRWYLVLVAEKFAAQIEAQL